MSGVPNFPELVGVAVVDEVQILYYDSNIETVRPKQDWMRKLLQDDPHQHDWYVAESINQEPFLRAMIDSLKKCLNQTEGTVCLLNVLSVKFLPDENKVQSLPLLFSQK